MYGIRAQELTVATALGCGEGSADQPDVVGLPEKQACSPFWPSFTPPPHMKRPSVETPRAPPGIGGAV